MVYLDRISIENIISFIDPPGYIDSYSGIVRVHKIIRDIKNNTIEYRWIDENIDVFGLMYVRYDKVFLLHTAMYYQNYKFIKYLRTKFEDIKITKETRFKLNNIFDYINHKECENLPSVMNIVYDTVGREIISTVRSINSSGNSLYEFAMTHEYPDDSIIELVKSRPDKLSIRNKIHFNMRYPDHSFKLPGVKRPRQGRKLDHLKQIQDYISTKDMTKLDGIGFDIFDPNQKSVISYYYSTKKSQLGRLLEYFTNSQQYNHMKILLQSLDDTNLQFASFIIYLLFDYSATKILISILKNRKINKHQKLNGLFTQVARDYYSTELISNKMKTDVAYSDLFHITRNMIYVNTSSVSSYYSWRILKLTKYDGNDLMLPGGLVQHNINTTEVFNKRVSESIKKTARISIAMQKYYRDAEPYIELTHSPLVSDFSLSLYTACLYSVAKYRIVEYREANSICRFKSIFERPTENDYTTNIKINTFMKNLLTNGVLY